MATAAAADPKKLGWVKYALGVTIRQEGDGLDVGELSELGLDLKDMWASARAAFGNATDHVDKQISALQSALRDADDVDYEEIAEFGLNGLTDGTRVPLQAAMLEAGTGDLTKVRNAAPKLLKAIGKFRVHLASDPRIAACDENPLGVEVGIRATYYDVLDQLEDVAIAAMERA